MYFRYILVYFFIDIKINKILFLKNINFIF